MMMSSKVSLRGHAVTLDSGAALSFQTAARRDFAKRVQLDLPGWRAEPTTQVPPPNQRNGYIMNSVHDGYSDRKCGYRFESVQVIPTVNDFEGVYEAKRGF